MASSKLQVAKRSSNNGSTLRKRSYANIPTVLDVPNLIQVQLDSFNSLKSDGV